MENKEAIYNFLKTLPVETTVGEVISNLDNEREELIKKQKEQIEQIKKNCINTVFYCEDKDDDKVVCRYLTFVKEFRQKSFTDLTFVCDVIATSNCQIHYETDIHVDARALNVAKKVDMAVYEKALKNIEEMKNIIA